MNKLLFLPLLAALAGCADKTDAPTPAAPTAAAASADNRVSGVSYMGRNQYLLAGDYLRSGNFALVLERHDGTLVLYEGRPDGSRVARWVAPNTTGRGGNKLIMQQDGWLVLYNTNANVAVWALRSCGWNMITLNGDGSAWRLAFLSCPGAQSISQGGGY